MAVYRQEINNKPFSRITGILFIVAVVVFLSVLRAVLGYCQQHFGLSYDNGIIILWLVGGGLTMFVMQNRTLSFHYTLDGSNLKLDRIYGKYVRPVRTIMFRRIEDIGTPEEMLKKYPGSRKEHLTRDKYEREKVAIVHIAEEKRYITVIQPDEKILEALKNRKKG